MIRSILVPTDFSDNALKAALYAAEIAKKSGAAIFLLHVIEPVADNIRQPFSLHEKYVEEVTNSRTRELKELLDCIKEVYPGISIETALANGAVSTAVPEFAAKKEIDLIIMGTKGATGLKEIFMGSVTAATIGHATIPVLAVPQEYIMEEPDALLFATNRFEKNVNLLGKIMEIAKLFSAAIHVVVFVDKDDADDYIDKAGQLDDYRAFLQEKFPGITCKAEIIEGKDFGGTVELYDVRNEVDIIAMITYPKSMWEKFLRKSATKKMAFHSTIPVLAIPAE